MEKMKFGIKEKMITFITILILLTLVIISFYSLFNLNTTLYQEKENQVKEMVEAVSGLINYYYEMEVEGLLSREEAQSRAAAAVENMTFGPGNQDYYWINDFEPVMIMHPYSKHLEGENIASVQDPDGKNLFVEMVEIVEREGEGFVEYQWQYYDQEEKIEAKISYVKGFNPWNWIIGTGVYIDDINNSYIGLRNRFLMIGSAILILSLILTYLLSNYLSKPIILLTVVIDKLADYDLKDYKKEEVENYSKRSDEIGSIAASIKLMKKNLLKSVNAEVEIADNLAASGEELSASSEEMSASASEVSESIKKLAQGTVKQNDMLKNTENNIEQLDKKIDLISDKAGIIKNESQSAEKEVKKGSSAVNTTAEEIKNVVKNQQTVIAKVNELEELSGQIGKIVEIINGIADQTNLLALNAAIEAARAGEAGRGFSVVAEEIRELAEESSDATDEINSLIKEIQKKVNDTTEMMEASDQGVQASSQAVKEAESTFKEIENTVLKLRTLITEIAKSSQEMKLNSKDVNLAVEELADISSDSASIAEEVAAAADDQSNSTVEIVKAAEDLAEMAQKLTQITSNYKR